MILKSSSGMDRIKNVLYDNVSLILQWVSSALCDDEGDKRTHLYSVEVVVGGSLSGPCPVCYTACIICADSQLSYSQARK